MVFHIVPEKRHRIFIDRLSLQTLIGVSPEERTSCQRVLVSVALDVVYDQRDKGDRLVNVVDYQDIIDRIRQEIERKTMVHLIETLAERIAKICLTDERVAVVHVQVEKPDILADLKSVGVSVTYSRGSC